VKETKETDLLIYGVSFEIDGKHVPYRDVVVYHNDYKQPEYFDTGIGKLIGKRPFNEKDKDE